MQQPKLMQCNALRLVSSLLYPVPIPAIHAAARTTEKEDLQQQLREPRTLPPAALPMAELENSTCQTDQEQAWLVRPSRSPGSRLLLNLLYLPQVPTIEKSIENSAF